MESSSNALAFGRLRLGFCRPLACQLVRMHRSADFTIVSQIVRPEVSPRMFESEEIRFLYRPAFILVDPLGSNTNDIILRW